MARRSDGPWFRAAKNSWYVWHQGRQVALGVRGAENERDAVRAWHRLMANGRNQPPTQKPARTPTVREMTDAYLEAKRGTVKDHTHEVYGYLLGHAVRKFGRHPADSLRPVDVNRWINAHPVSVSTRADIARVLACAFRWAEAEGLLPSNPLRGMKRPAVESRGAQAVIAADTHQKLLAAASVAFRRVLVHLWETGARPSELARITAADVDFVNHVAVVKEHKTAHSSGQPRLIVLTPSATGVLKQAASEHPVGPVLRHSQAARGPVTQSGWPCYGRRNESA